MKNRDNLIYFRKSKISRMKLHAILMLSTCLALVNTLSIEEMEENSTRKSSVSFLGDMKRTVHELNTSPGIQLICVWKICSRRIRRPVIADHFRGIMKATNKWWDGLFDNKQRRPNINYNKAFRITDILLGRQ